MNSIILIQLYINYLRFRFILELYLLKKRQTEKIKETEQPPRIPFFKFFKGTLSS